MKRAAGTPGQLLQICHKTQPLDQTHRVQRDHFSGLELHKPSQHERKGNNLGKNQTPVHCLIILYHFCWLHNGVPASETGSTLLLTQTEPTQSHYWAEHFGKGIKGPKKGIWEKKMDSIYSIYIKRIQPVIIGDKERTLTILLNFGLEHGIRFH